MTSQLPAPGTGGCLPQIPRSEPGFATRIQRDYERFAAAGLPDCLEQYLLEAYGVDVATEYAGIPIRNPWGKASGQLSMNLRQVEEDIDAGLGFVVLKTVIAQDSGGDQSMQAWAVREARMKVESIQGRNGQTGWTVSWKGRGWWQPFSDYLDLVREANRQGSRCGTLIIPSCKYHLPGPDESDWRTDEYRYTTEALWQAWQAGHESAPTSMPLEKDFSPTLAGSDRATARQKILDWLRRVPALIRQSVSHGSEPPVRVGLKLFNAVFEDEFQLELLKVVHQMPPGDRADFFVYGNRLFDPDREFDGHRGIAYGGPDLSDRNLRIMTAFAGCELNGDAVRLPWSATGDICSGRMAIEYALLGATTFQLHTYFQLPLNQYSMKRGSRTERALHELYFHPHTGLLAWLEHCRLVTGRREPLTIGELHRNRAAVTRSSN